MTTRKLFFRLFEIGSNQFHECTLEKKVECNVIIEQNYRIYSMSCWF